MARRARFSLILGFWGSLLLAICPYEAVRAQAEGLDPQLRRVEDSAAKYQEEFAAKGQTVGMARYANFDFAWPESAEELAALGGNTVILITALSHHADELPLGRAYIQEDEKVIALQRIAATPVLTLPSGLKAATLFGEYRSDVFYLVPVSAFLTKGRLLVDFAANRSGFVLTTLPFTLPERKGFLTENAAGLTPTPPSGTALKAFINREWEKTELRHFGPNGSN